MPLKRRFGRLEEPLVFFVDRCLGKRVVPEALRRALLPGERVEVHDAHFPQAAKDADWLVAVGQRGWVVLSQDQHITRNPLEQGAVLGAGVAFFGLGQADAQAAEVARALVLSLSAIRRAVRRFRVPIIATVTVHGEVVVKWEAGDRCATPRRIKPGKAPDSGGGT